MTDMDLDVVERYVLEVWRPTKLAPRPPVARSEECDRIEIDLSKWQEKCDADILIDRLAQTMGAKGYDLDFWFPEGDKNTICVSYKEREE